MNPLPSPRMSAAIPGGFTFHPQESLRSSWGLGRFEGCFHAVLVRPDPCIGLLVPDVVVCIALMLNRIDRLILSIMRPHPSRQLLANGDRCLALALADDEADL